MARAKSADIDKVFGCTYEDAMALPWPPPSRPWRRNRLAGRCARCQVELAPLAGLLGVVAGVHRYLCREHEGEASRG